MRDSFDFSSIKYLEITHLEFYSKFYPDSRIHTFIVNVSEGEQNNQKKKKNIETAPTHLERLPMYDFERVHKHGVACYL